MWSQLDESDDEDVSMVADDQFRTYAYRESQRRRIRKIACGVAAGVLVLVLLIVGISVLSTSDATSDASNAVWYRANMTELRLPTYVVPTAYRLDLEPDLDTFKLYGVAEIDIEFSDLSDEVLLHALDINVTSALLRVSEQAEQHAADSIEYAGGDQQYVKLRFGALRQLLVRPTTSFVLRISYEGRLGDDMTGFYRSAHVDAAGQRHWLAATQFEAVGARRAFPCFDEPAFKATFDVALRVDTARFPTVLSNQPETSRGASASLRATAATGAAAPLQRVVFERTPRMSTYLVAFVVADFGSYRAPKIPTGSGHPGIEPPEPRVDIHIYSTHDTINQTHYAAHVARDVLAIYEDFFGIQYPLAKLDLIAVPDFAAGAMENWGLITFRTTALLFDARHSSAADKERVAVVVAHEIAHQWFGNLVTMQWWDELWLNEGFATFCEYYAINEMYAAETNVEHDRGWLMWQEFTADRDSALYLDALDNSHPIRQPAARPSEIEELFDSISYSKGGSLLRMLYKSSVMSSGNFQKGLHNYLAKHKYGNARSADLWAELAAASGESALPARLETWVAQPGYPVITFEQAGPDSYVALQHRYLEQPPAGQPPVNGTWWVPLNIQNNAAQTEVRLLGPRSEPFSVSADYFVANADRWGLYRIAYPASLQRPLLGHLQRNGIGVGVDSFNHTLQPEHRPWTPLDYAGTVNDVLSFSASGFNGVTAADVLDLAMYVSGTHNYICWSEAINAIETVARRLEAAGSPLATDVHDVTRQLLKPLVTQWTDMGSNIIDDDDDVDEADHSQQLLRELLMPLAVRLDIVELTQHASACWRSVSGGGTCASGVLKKLPGLVPPQLQGAVFQWAALNNATAFDDLLAHYNASTFPGERRRLQTALTYTKDATARSRLLNMAIDLDGAVRKQDRASVIVGVAARSNEGRAEVWRLLKSTFAQLAGHHDGLFGGVSTLVAGVVRGFGTRAELNDAKQFIATNMASGLDGRDVKQAVEVVEHTIAWVAANEQPIREWLQKRNMQ